MHIVVSVALILGFMGMLLVALLSVVHDLLVRGVGQSSAEIDDRAKRVDGVILNGNAVTLRSPTRG